MWSSTDGWPPAGLVLSFYFPCCCCVADRGRAVPMAWSTTPISDWIGLCIKLPAAEATATQNRCQCSEHAPQACIHTECSSLWADLFALFAVRLIARALIMAQGGDGWGVCCGPRCDHKHGLLSVNRGMAAGHIPDCDSGFPSSALGTMVPTTQATRMVQTANSSRQTVPGPGGCALFHVLQPRLQL